MIEQDARATIHPVSLAILLHNPKTIQFRNSIRRIRMERRQLILRHLFHLAVKLRRRSLVDAARILQPAQTHRLQDTQHPRCIHVGRELRRVERYLHMALCRQIINLIRTYLGHNLHNRHGIPQVSIMQMEMPPTLKMGYTFAEIHARTPDSAMHIITLLQQKLGQERSVLTRNPGN